MGPYALTPSIIALKNALKFDSKVLKESLYSLDKQTQHPLTVSVFFIFCWMNKLQ